jgi:hypothetical protein
MKAIWSSCTRAFSLPGLRRKRGREEDLSQANVIPESKRAKVGPPKTTKSVDVDGELY